MADLLVGLGDTGEDDALRGHAGRGGTKDLAARHGVGAGAGQRQRADHGQIVVGLERIAEERRLPAKGALQGREAPAHGAGRVDIDGRPGLGGDQRERHPLGGESAVPIGEGLHWVDPPECIAGPAPSIPGGGAFGEGSWSFVPELFCPGGSSSAPRRPQPPSPSTSMKEKSERKSVRRCHMTSDRSARVPIAAELAQPCDTAHEDRAAFP